MQKLDEKYPNLEDHIDEPIKKCVVGLSLLGFNSDKMENWPYAKINPKN